MGLVRVLFVDEKMSVGQESRGWAREGARGGRRTLGDGSYFRGKSGALLRFARLK